MKLYDLMGNGTFDEDTYDTVFDAEVTCCWDGTQKSPYDEFCQEVYERVEVERVSPNLVCRWSEFVYDSKDVFADFFYDMESPDDETVADNIDQLNLFLSGSLSEESYIELIERFAIAAIRKCGIEVSDEDIAEAKAMCAEQRKAEKELLPCPCCGGRGLLKSFAHPDGEGGAAYEEWVECESCGLRSKDVESWQRRV